MCRAGEVKAWKASYRMFKILQDPDTGLLKLADFSSNMCTSILPHTDRPMRLPLIHLEQYVSLLGVPGDDTKSTHAVAFPTKDVGWTLTKFMWSPQTSLWVCCVFILSILHRRWTKDLICTWCLHRQRLTHQWCTSVFYPNALIFLQYLKMPGLPTLTCPCWYPPPSLKWLPSPSKNNIKSCHFSSD